VTITKELSGAARAAIDAVRTLFVWAFSVAVHWERFHALQVRSGHDVVVVSSSCSCRGTCVMLCAMCLLR